MAGSTSGVRDNYGPRRTHVQKMMVSRRIVRYHEQMTKSDSELLTPAGGETAVSGTQMSNDAPKDNKVGR